MPTYEYRCPSGHEFEKFFRTISSATTENACPTCGVIAVRQMSSGAGLKFKGSGFYLTDYGKNAHANKGPAPTGGGEGSGGAGDSAPAGDTGSGGGSGAAPASGASKADSPASSSGSGGESGGTSSTPKPKPSE